MKLKELKEKTKDELKDLLLASRRKIREYNFKIATSQIKNVREVRKNKKMIAQILTLLKEQENK